MIQKLILIKSESLNPYNNQAIEASLMEFAQENSFVLYLWANDNTVFIGKNQNAFLECNLALLKENNGFLARRITGGGAVYHDKGNINFTFVAPKEDYSKDRQFKIILNALNSLGIEAQLSGRNDITIAGKKFSGNAFYNDNKVGLHHGTILINSNYSLIAKYLSVNKLKLMSKGVNSVESRIINLTEVKSDTDKDEISAAIIKAAEQEFKLKSTVITQNDIAKNLLDKWLKIFSDKSHIEGDDVYYDARVEHKFDWGLADIRLKVEGQIITAAKIYSDTLDINLITKKESELIGTDIHKLRDPLNKSTLT